MRSTRRPSNRLERTLVMVLAGFIAVNLLLIVPAFASELRLDRLHPSLPIVNLRPLAEGRAQIADALGDEFTAPVRAIAGNLRQAGAKAYNAVYYPANSTTGDTSGPTEKDPDDQGNNEAGIVVVPSATPTPEPDNTVEPTQSQPTQNPSPTLTSNSGITPTSGLPSPTVDLFETAVVQTATALAMPKKTKLPPPTPTENPWESPTPTSQPATLVLSPASTTAPTNTPSPPPKTKIPPPTSTQLPSYTPTSTQVLTQDPTMTPSQVAVLTATLVHTAVQTTSPTPVWEASPLPSVEPSHTPTIEPSSTATSMPLSPTPLPATGMYYVAPDGDDANPGSIDSPWRTLAAVHSRNFLPGDVIHFRRGSSWSGGLVIDDSGLDGDPITFTTYGSGSRPAFSNPGGAGNYTRSIEISADWIVLDGFLAQNSHEAGVYISNGSDHNVIRNIEATNVGIGIAIHGRHNIVTKNFVHDLHMVHNTPGGNDDYGAVGIWMFNSNNEVSYNRIENCKASSYDYGLDGGAFEWWGSADGNQVHHNWATGSHGFLEVGGGSARNTSVHHNISVNNSQFTSIHLEGVFASDVRNFRVENNTIVETASNDQGWVVIGFIGDPSPDTLLLRNNILWIERGSDFYQWVSNKSSFTHEYNIYHLIGELPLGFELARGEQIADPLFASVNSRDFHLGSGSPAIDSGINLGYSLDFEGLSVPRGAAPDIGALEHP